MANFLETSASNTSVASSSSDSVSFSIREENKSRFLTRATITTASVAALIMPALRGDLPRLSISEEKSPLRTFEWSSNSVTILQDKYIEQRKVVADYIADEDTFTVDPIDHDILDLV